MPHRGKTRHRPQVVQAVKPVCCSGAISVLSCLDRRLDGDMTVASGVSVHMSDAVPDDLAGAIAGVRAG